MRGANPLDSSNPAVSGWAFCARKASLRPRDEDDAFHRRLDAALRSARGQAISFRLRIRAGRTPSLSLFAESPAGRTWVARAFLPSYDRTAWRTTREGSSLAAPTLWGDRARPWPRPLGPSGECATLLDAWLLTGASLPSDVFLEIGCRSDPARVPRWKDLGAAASEPSGHDLRSAPHRGRAGPVPGRSPPSLESAAAGGWHVSIALGSTRTDGAAHSLRGSAIALEHASRTTNGNGIRFRPARWPARATGRAFWLAECELALLLPRSESPALAGPPGGSVERPLLVLGRTDAGSIIGPPIEAAQGRHLAILGETGMGKSSLLLALARRVSRDSGLVLLDPLGGTAEALVRELPPPARSRLLRIAPVGFPRRLNALGGAASMRAASPVRSERRLNDLVHSLRRVRSGRYADSSYWGPRLEEMLTWALEAAASWPEGTLADAHALLATRGRLHRPVPDAAFPAVAELARRVRERPDDAEGARRLLHEVVRSPVLEPMLCSERPELSASDLVRPGQVVVISGDAGEIGESTARYLLSTYLALVWSEILSRSESAKIYLFLDEAQWFAHESLAEMLRLGRAANVHVVLATQAIASLPTAVGEAVWTNVADFVAFRGSPEEAREFAGAAHGVSIESVLSLPRGRAAVLIGKGESVHWLRTVRLPERTEPHRESESLDRTGRRRVPADGPALVPPPFRPDAVWTPPRSPSVGAPEPADRSEEKGRSQPDIPGPKPVIDYLRSRARSSGEGALVRISLRELRSCVDPEGELVRRAGAELRALGALITTEHGEAGTVWTVDTGRLGPPGADGHAPEDGETAPQPS